jgi:hypothetical protein
VLGVWQPRAQQSYLRENVKAISLGFVGGVASLLAVSACPPSPVPPPTPPDATDAIAPPVAPEASPPVPKDVCLTACATAKRLGCPEGNYGDCSLTCAKILADVHQVHFDPVAITAAKTQDDVRAAGWSCTVK